MSLPTTVPFELFEALSSQLEQALQMIAALTLTDEEVITCKNPKKGLADPALDEEEEDEEDDSSRLLGWAESMKADLLAPGEYGRDAMIDMLTRHGFLTNTHAGFIYGAFEGPQITYHLANEADLFINILNDYVAGVGEDIEPDDLEEYVKQRLREEGTPEDHIQYIFNIMAVKIPRAVLSRMSRERAVKLAASN